MKLGIRFVDVKGEIHGDLAYVRAACEGSLNPLDIDSIDLDYQDRIDTNVPIEYQERVGPRKCSSINNRSALDIYGIDAKDELIKMYPRVAEASAVDTKK